MEKFFMGFEKRIDETEKVAMGAKIIGGIKGIAQRVSNYFSRGVPKAIRNTQSGGAGMVRGTGTKAFPGVESHRMSIPKAKRAPIPVRSNPLPGRPLDYSKINAIPQGGSRTINYSNFR